MHGDKYLFNAVKFTYNNFMPKKQLLSILLIFILAAAFAVPQENIFPPRAIIVASYCGDYETVRQILETGPDKNVRDDFGDTALHVAMYQKNLALIKLLLDYGFDPNAKTTKNGNTPLHNAVASNNIGAARLLLQYQANKNIRNLEGQTPLDKARKEEKKELIMLLYR